MVMHRIGFIHKLILMMRILGKNPIQIQKNTVRYRELVTQFHESNEFISQMHECQRNLMSSKRRCKCDMFLYGQRFWFTYGFGNYVEFSECMQIPNSWARQMYMDQHRFKISRRKISMSTITSWYLVISRAIDHWFLDRVLFLRR